MEKDNSTLEDIGAIVAGVLMGGGILVLIWAWIHYT